MSPLDEQTQPAAASIGSNGTIAESAAPVAPAKPGMPKRWLYAVLILAFLFVLMPYLFWQATWFGRPLNDEQMARAITDTSHPREVQHALSQLADRMLSPDPRVRESARKWYPNVIAISFIQDDELRLTTAWVMQQDNSVPEFHSALVRLLADSNTMVSRNAALALVRFNDPAGHDVIVKMLLPWQLTASAPGKLYERAGSGDNVTAGTRLGRIEVGAAVLDVRAGSPGTLGAWSLPDESNVAEGQAIATINPSSDMVWEALRALYIIGKPDDESAVEPYTRAIKGVPPQTAQQASQTLDAIKSRAAANGNPPPAPEPKTQNNQ